MINKHSIYNWLFFPLLASLLAGSVASCSNDPSMEEDTSGKSTLSIKVRGITTTDPGSSGSYDDYVKTLRVIGYDNTGAVVCNQKYSGAELGTVEGTDPNTYIEITQTLEDAFQGGVCDFYFIANEDGYSVYNSQTTPKPTLSTFLGDNAENAPSKDGLNSCIIAFDAQNGLTPGYPILMTVHSTSQFLKPGNNEMGRIYLERCLARVQLNITKDASFTGDVSVGNVKLTGSCPDSYSLWNTGTYTGYTAQPIDRELNNVGTGNGIFTSSALMFPEKLGKGGSTTTDTDLKYTFSLTSGTTTKNYEIRIGKGQDTDQSVIEDNNIYRNHWYTTMAKYYGMQGSLGITFEVEDWKTKPYKYELSDVGTFTTKAPNDRSFEYETRKSAIATQYSTEAGASSRQATFTVEMTTPVGVRWMAHLTNAQDFEFVTDENHAAEGVGGSSPVTLLIRPTKSFDATGERPYTELYVTLGTAPDNKQKFVDPGDYCSSDGTSIPIVQVSATEGDALWGTSVEP